MRHLPCICLLFVLTGLLPALAQMKPPEVVIEGLPKELRQNVELLLGIEQRKDDPLLTQEAVRALHERAPAEIRRALEAFGYYRPKIQSTLVQEDGRWVAHYTIDAGPVLHVDAVDVHIAGDGADDPEFKKLLETLPLRQGESLRHANYEQSKRALLDLAAERGYLDARLTRSELLVDLDRYTATAVLHLESGARYRFGAVRFEQEFFDAEFLARFVPFKPGDPYSTSGLVQLQTGLSNTEYFKQVDVRPRRDLTQDLVVPVEVTLKLREPNKYTVGIGFGTDTGARAKFGWERRLINPSGDRFIAALDVSQVRNTADVRYLIPVFDPRTDHVALSASLHDDEATSFTSKRSVLGVGLSHTRRSWRELLSLNYQRERFTAGSDSGVATLLIPGAGWTYVRADNRLQPRHGGRVQFELRGANEHAGSDLSFWQLHVGGKYIVPVGSGARIITRADAGHISTQRFRELPASLRFYTGGSQSVRGYPYQGLAAVDEAGLTIGGSNLLVGSIELEQRVWQAVSAAVFYDTGKAFNDSSEPFNDGAGVGLRWRLPVGLLQLDVAQALTREGKPWRVHFLIGAEL